MTVTVKVLPPSSDVRSAISAFMRAVASPDQQKLVIGYLLSDLCVLNDPIYGLESHETQRLLGRRDVALSLMEISGQHQKIRFEYD